jgi:hypothetical protein
MTKGRSHYINPRSERDGDINIDWLAVDIQSSHLPRVNESLCLSQAGPDSELFWELLLDQAIWKRVGEGLRLRPHLCCWLLGVLQETWRALGKIVATVWLLCVYSRCSLLSLLGLSPRESTQKAFRPVQWSWP